MSYPFSMLIVIVCGGEECGKEFRADTKDRKWVCPHCGRAIENKFYPFLNARLMQARIDKDAADWKTMFEGLREEANNLFKDRTERLARLRRELEGTPGAPIDTGDIKSPFAVDAPTKDGEDAGGKEWRGLYEDLFKSARAIIIEKDDEIDALKKELDDKRKTDKDKGKGEAKGTGKGKGKEEGPKGG
jgi:hypothetical protein